MDQEQNFVVPKSQISDPADQSFDTTLSNQLFKNLNVWEKDPKWISSYIPPCRNNSSC